ncbi:MAG: RNA ligase family protein [Candidatus Aenigmarchaeota archaeon]|nr:RNA ligase family protein [Candidatus Aenigmarchaeota archaeon]MBU5689234.1 RNA ligase family protein [Candidatus Aenigmarchaeota archaeon]
MKFPRTPHVYAEYSGLSLDDKRYSTRESEEILEGKYVVLTEKLDGSNVSIEFESNGELSIKFRGNPAATEEFNLLKNICNSKHERLKNILGQNLILFGEWVYCLHTIRYSRLPHYLFIFDLYDKKREIFLPYRRVIDVSNNLRFPTPRILYEGIYPGFEYLKNLLDLTSAYGDEKIEGVYGKIEDDEKVIFRFKFVNPEFRKKVDESIHWKKKQPEIQGLIVNINELFL